MLLQIGSFPYFSSFR